MCSSPRAEPGRVGSGPDALAEGLLAGDRRVLARAITLVESTRPDHRAEAEVARQLAGLEEQVRAGTITPAAAAARLLEAFRGGKPRQNREFGRAAGFLPDPLSP